ncbi:NAD(P)-dependent oxidoreductase [Sedimentitalea todarodis]|uniref:NAD(P)-dependent oxidoreductase n=1 Tax=Sedimentitalea todarodis TaxID=1631240 RepID=A0ABU3VDH7_9RHOB|nr:NAD(P)-dependent oxidoreductase [Sedimentitalea todarodis]MDU9004211.1 NAD(P)-dependent oxidoreductase [Sedimentitalea todarodis]
MAGSKVIFSTHALHPDVTRDLQSLGDYRVSSAPTPDAILKESAGAEIIVVRAKISPEIIARERGLMACVRHGAGLDMIPMDAASQAGVLVANVPGANATTVAEHVIWSALALLRKYPQVSCDLRASGWEPARVHSNHGHELSGRTIGILGAGNIGRRVAEMARHGFGCNVIALTRTPTTLPEWIEHVPFDQLLARSDILALTCPLTSETQGIIDRAAIAKMKQGAVLINVSRGQVTDEMALAEALASGKLRGAAVDVFCQQPLPPDHPFLALHNVILTPHMAGITEESMLRMGQGVVAETRRILSGKKPRNFCNPEVWERHRKRFGLPS